MTAFTLTIIQLFSILWQGKFLSTPQFSAVQNLKKILLKIEKDRLAYFNISVNL